MAEDAQRFWLLFDARGSEEGMVLESLGEHPSKRKAKKDARSCWQGHHVVLCSYAQDDDGSLIDEIEEFRGYLH